MSLTILPQLKPRLISTMKFYCHAHVQSKPICPCRTASTAPTPRTILPVASADLSNKKTSGRVYPIRKQFIFESYAHLLTQNRVCLFFRHESLTPKEWNSIRGQLARLSVDDVDKESKLHLQVLRTRMIAPVLKDLNAHAKIGRKICKSLSPHLKGNLVCLSQRVFHPSRIQAALAILSKHSSVPAKTQSKQTSTHKANKSSTVVDRLPFVIGILDDNVQAEKARVEELSRLPGLETLRQQILGLITSVGAQLVGTVNHGRGGMVVRTLDGYRETLHKQDQPENQVPNDNL